MVSISSQVEPSKPQNSIQILLVVWLLSHIWKDLIMNEGGGRDNLLLLTLAWSTFLWKCMYFDLPGFQSASGQSTVLNNWIYK